MPHSPDYQNLIPLALKGDMDALEEILLSVRDQIYNLSLRFLWDPQEAEDATQEILVKIMLHLNQFEYRAAFSTWTYRIATNYLIDTRKTLLERSSISFEDVAREIQSVETAPEAHGKFDDSFDPKVALKDTAREVQTACTHGMLQCLDRSNRAAFILGEVFNMHSDEASFILGISASAYRQRLSRARKRMDGFLNQNCGIMNPQNPCRCETRACQLQSSRTLEKYMRRARTLERSDPQAAEIEGSALSRMALIYRSNRSYIPRPVLLDRIKRTLQKNYPF